MSRILSRISMSTGHTSSHARHEVQAHNSAALIRSNTESAVTVIAASTPAGGLTGGLAIRAATSPSLRTISRGSSGLPVWLAGDTEGDRPQIVPAAGAGSGF